MFLGFSAPAALHGTREEILGTEAVWQTPPGTAKGLLFLAHGCNHGAIDFWPQSAACTQCIGLPEEVRITKETLRAGWAVIAISSADRDGSRCWSIESDGPAVAGRQPTATAAATAAAAAAATATATAAARQVRWVSFGRRTGSPRCLSPRWVRAAAAPSCCRRT